MKTTARPHATRLTTEPPAQPQVLVWTLRAALVTGADRWLDWESPSLAPAGLQVLEDSDCSNTATRRRLIRAALQKAERRLRSSVREDALLENVRLLAGPLALEPEECLLLALAAAAAIFQPLNACFDSSDGRSHRARVRAVAQVLGLPERRALHAVRPDGPLARLGLLRMGGSRHRSDWFSLRDNLEALLLQEYPSPQQLLEHFAHPAPPAELALADWPHLARDLELVLAALRGALDQRTGGFHVLLYGIAGTGKTQLARSLAAELGSPLLEVSVEDEDHDPLHRFGRMSNYWICQHYGGRLPRALVAFDEMEDLFETGGGLFGRDSSSHKGFLNRLLEETPIPTLWCSNQVHGVDEAFLRRFDLALEVPTPPKAVRRLMLERHLGQLGLSGELLDRVAAAPAVTPADCERAARAVRLAGLTGDGAAGALERVLQLRLEVRGKQPPKKGRGDRLPVYGLRFVNADHAPEKLVAGLQATGSGTVLFHGPPGTGKSAFAAHLSEILGKPLLVRYGSDLLDKYVGETEKALARMFDEARAEGAVLFLDEADSFLGARAAASQRWEISHTNELLVRMEQFDGIFLCATNRLEALDPACLRRFGLKVGFKPMTTPQAAELFAEVLAAAGAPAPDETGRIEASLARLPQLAPGDFAAVWRRLRALGGAVTAESLLAGLEGEAAVKAEARRAIGF